MDKVSDIEQLKSIANDVRKDIISMIYTAGSGHPGGSLSATEAMVALFFNIMNHDPKNPDDKARDRFIISKGHCTPVYYSVLARSGYLDVDELSNFRKINSRLQGHPDKSKFPLMETTSGSLGQGLSIASGIAFASRLDSKDLDPNKTPKIYCMIGDGELDEGQIWEALATIRKYKLANLIIILDNNKIQLDGPNVEIKDMEILKDKFLAFNHEVLEMDGHDFKDILETFDDAKRLSDEGKNTIIISHTIKGKGVSFMENTSEWHGKAPNQEEYEKAMKELEAN
jgi:transketolase